MKSWRKTVSGLLLACCPVVTVAPRFASSIAACPGKHVLNSARRSLCRDRWTGLCATGVRWSLLPCRALHTTSSMEKEDYYKILGVPRNASTKEIKKAYYELAKKYHPDRNKGDPESAKTFTQIGEAYEVLSDDEKRRIYDATGHSEYTSTGGPGGGAPFSTMQAEEIFRQFFGDFDLGSMFGNQGFGGGASSTHQQLVLDLAFMEAVQGCSRQIPLRVQASCSRCFGSGGEPGTKEQTCPYCRGRGEEVINTGLFHMKSTCRRCHGQGKIITTPCKECGGTGTTIRTQTINVQVPAGVSDGQTLRVPVEHSEAFIVLKVTLPPPTPPSLQISVSCVHPLFSALPVSFAGAGQ